MQIICISEGSHSHGAEFAQALAAKLDYECISRKQLLEEATKRRIPIGKLEMAIVNPRIFTDKLALELEHYKALATSILCEKALKNNIVYHGRTGHLLLPGITHILKIRIETDTENRIKYVVENLKLSREKAKLYIDQVDQDRRKWVRTFYKTEWDVFHLYDLILNLSYMSINNASTAVCSMAQLPEFQETPYTVHALKDLYLASKAHLLLFSDKRTNSFNLRIKSNSRILNVTYPVHLSDKIDLIDSILKNLEDIDAIVYTKAQTNILWIQEQFNENDESYNQVLSLANNWDAAVELLKMVPSDNPDLVQVTDNNTDTEHVAETWRDTGIIEEIEEIYDEASEDMLKICKKLINDGRAGGKKTIIGSQKTLLNSIDKTANYRLIIFDNTFLSLGSGARKRLLQEWSNSITEQLNIPVVNINELEVKYKFLPKHYIQLFLNSGITAIFLFLIFTFSSDIISFMTSSDSQMKIIATICVLIFVPVFAHIYSTATGLLLKLLKFE